MRTRTGRAAGLAGHAVPAAGIATAGAGASASKRFHRPRGGLAAGDAEGGRGFTPLGQRIGVGAAEIAALAAIELAHRGHQPILERLALGERHALVQFEGRVVPGEVFGFGLGRGAD